MTEEDKNIAREQPESNPSQSTPEVQPEPNEGEAAPETTETPVAEDNAIEGKMELMRQEMEAAQTKADEYLDGWQRARAEFANYKRRIDREQTQVYQVATANIIKRFLDILDDLERALKNKPQDEEGEAWAEGIELIYRKFITVLEAEGVKPMEADGEYFDPNLHEAISHEDNEDFDSGQIIEVVKRGYYLEDRILRPAMVRVAR
jgi:molecular chaperone GrpE